MGLDTVSFFSDTVCKMAIKSDCAVRCRTAASTLNELTGLNLSHQIAWRIVENAGSRELGTAYAEVLAEAAKAERGAGTCEIPMQYEKMNGMYLSLQGKDGLEHGPGKNCFGERSQEFTSSTIFQITHVMRGIDNRQQSGRALPGIYHRAAAFRNLPHTVASLKRLKTSVWF